MKPLISVIIPCYNQARFLGDAVNCLIQQTYENWECIIVNDGSTDNTATVAASFSQSDQRVRIVNQNNLGLSGARNTGLNNAKGHYIQFLDADDQIDQNKFLLQLKALSSIEEPCLSYSDYLMGLEDDIRQTPLNIQRTPPRLLMDNPLQDIAARWETELSIPVHCFLFDARFFCEKNIRFDESLPNHEDWDCWMQIFAFNPKIKLIPEPLAIYRLNNHGMCVNKAKMWKGFKLAIVKQRNIHRHDIVMNKILAKKYGEMKKKYQATIIQRITVPVISLYQKKMPWPIQQFIARSIKVIYKN